MNDAKLGRVNIQKRRRACKVNFLLLNDVQ